MRLDPALKPLGFEYDAMLRIVVAHPRQRFSKPLLQHRIKIGSGREHAVIIRWRGPDFGERTLRNEALDLHCFPERTADCSGVGTTVENSANDLHLTGAGIAVLADVAVEAQRAIVLSFLQTFFLKEVYR